LLPSVDRQRSARQLPLVQPRHQGRVAGRRCRLRRRHPRARDRAVLVPVTATGGSMARIPLVTREQIADEEKPAYDAFMASRVGRPNVGPYTLLLHMPEMAQRLEALRIYLRDEASLPQKLQELVMISVPRELGCAFIWYAHAAAARQAAARGDILGGLREKRARHRRRRE